MQQIPVRSLLPDRAWWLVTCLLVFAQITSAQQLKPDLYRDVFAVVEQEPRFPGGFQAMNRFLDTHVRYPDQAAKQNVTGKVYVQFVVEADGQLTQLEILKGVGFGCDEEALRVVKSMPRWKPGKQSGRPVRARKYVSIAFGMN